LIVARNNLAKQKLVLARAIGSADADKSKNVEPHYQASGGKMEKIRKGCRR
jgi:hypothetical protein